MKIFYTKIILCKTAYIRLIIFLGFLFVSINQTSAQVVSPLQTGHYMPGVTNIRDMAKPPSGLFVIWYNLFLNSESYYDRNGNELSQLTLSQIDPSLKDINIDLSGFATVPALFWASKFTLLGGANYMVGISPSYASASGTVGLEVAGSGLNYSDTYKSEGSVSGWGDLFVVPFGLSWGFESFDATVTYGFYAPTGRYETGADDNMGLGHWTHQFQGYGYYYPVVDRSSAIMVGLTYELPTEIKDAALTPGNRLSLEYGISQYLSSRLEVGIHGSHNWQVGDDTGDDVIYDASYHDRKSSLAFQASYWLWENKFYLSGKYMFDYGAAQRFTNTTFMLNFIFLTNLLTGE
jgi:hypothetical protein